MVVVPEHETTVDEIMREMKESQERGKPHFIMVVAEGAKPNASEICAAITASGAGGFEARLTVLGHVQRGGSPTAADRLLATKLGTAAVQALIEGRRGVMMGASCREVFPVPLDYVLDSDRPADADLVKLEEIIRL